MHHNSTKETTMEVRNEITREFLKELRHEMDGALLAVARRSPAPRSP
jgi:hypothetical protein